MHQFTQLMKSNSLHLKFQEVLNSSEVCVCVLQVKEELLVEALTKRKTVTVNDKLILPYSHSEVQQVMSSMSHTLYGKNSLFFKHVKPLNW